MKVQDIMNMSVATCLAHEPLNSVAQKLWDHDCGCLPVVDRDGRPLAMITDRDICMAAYTSGKPLAELRVAASMSKSLVSCRPQEELGAAAMRMGKHGVRRLPVVDADGKLVGIVSLNDFATAIAEGELPKLTNAAAAEALRVLQAVCHHRSAVPSAAAKPSTSVQPATAPLAGKSAPLAKEAGV